jgi:dolichol-phosphate mannosyltransferase
MNKLNVAVVMATYKEAPSIQSPVRYFVHDMQWSVCIVDDSPKGDKTGYFAAKQGAYVIERGEKLGIASAYVLGLKVALDTWDPDIVIQMDAGGTHHAQDAERLITQSIPYSLVIGSRFLNRPRFFTHRTGISLAAAWLMRRKGLRVQDATSGYRAWDATLLREVIKKPVQAEGFAFQLELLWRAYKAGAIIQEIPIQYELTNSTFKPGMIAEALRIYAGLK